MQDAPRPPEQYSPTYGPPPQPSQAPYAPPPYGQQPYPAQQPYPHYPQSAYPPQLGYPQPPYPVVPYGYAPPTNSGAATASLICGILAWTFGFVIPLVFPLAAVITGHVGRGEIRRANGRLAGNGMALTGLILGYVQIAFGVIILLFLIIAAATGSGGPPRYTL